MVNIGKLLNPQTYPLSIQKRNNNKTNSLNLYKDKFERIPSQKLNFGSAINPSKIYSNFKPNGFFSRHEPNQDIFKKLFPKGIKVGETTIKKKSTDERVNVDVIFKFSWNGKEQYELLKDKLLGYVNLERFNLTLRNGEHNKKVNEVCIWELVNEDKRDFTGIGTELLGIAIKRSFDSGCKGRISLTAENPIASPVGFYAERGFLPKYLDKNDHDKMMNKIEDVLKRKFDGLIDTWKVKQELDEYNEINMYLPDDSIRLWERVLKR